MNILDILIIAVVVLSGLFAFARGFVRECLAIASWAGAAAAALYGLPYLRPFAERFLPRGAIADAAAAGAAFIVALVVLSLVSGAIGRGVKRSALSALDRTLGLLFGLVRGAIIVAIGFLALGFVLPPGSAKPTWIAQSRTAPLFLGVTGAPAHVLPPSVRQRVAALNPKERVNQEFEDALRAYAIPASRDAAARHGISSEDQQRLNQLLERLSADPGAQAAVPRRLGGAAAQQ